MSDTGLFQDPGEASETKSLGALREKFQLALLSGGHPSIEAFLSDYAGDDTGSLILELIEVELQHQRTSGHSVDVETYVSRFPGHAEAIRARFVSASKQNSDAVLLSTVALDKQIVSDDGLKTIGLRKLGRYELQELVGRGGFGVVWRAFDPQLRRYVALKTPREDIRVSGNARHQFVAEGRKAGRLKHPGIARVYDAGEDQGTCYIISELLSGGTLREHMERGPLELGAAIALVREIALALDYAHRQGVVHRDIKPGNILLDADGRAYVSDFGLAKVEVGELSVIRPGEVVGTPAYMSPEQASGRGNEADARTDIYSLGVVLFELLAGCPPTGESYVDELLERIRQRHSPGSEGTNDEMLAKVGRICGKALAPLPENRYATAAEFAAELQELLRQDPPVPPALEPTPQAGGKRRVARRWFAGVAVAGSLFGVWMFAGRSVPPTAGVPVQIATDPPGAETTFIPLDPTTGIPQPARSVTASRSRLMQSRVARARLAPGRYLVVAVVDDQRFHEVYRTVPAPTSSNKGPLWHLYWQRQADGTVQLPTIYVPSGAVTEGMLRFVGSTNFRLGANSANPASTYWVQVPPFFADPQKISQEVFAKRIGTKDMLPSRFRNRSDEEKKPFNTGAAPLTYVSWDEAVHLAERAGQRLLEEAEYEFAASHVLDLAPNEKSTGDWLQSPAEWTNGFAISYPMGINRQVVSSGANDRVVRGLRKVPGDIVPGSDHGPHRPHEIASIRNFQAAEMATSDVSFRLARSTRPRLLPSDFVIAPLAKPR